MVVTQGYYINLVRLWGNTPEIFGQKEDFDRPLLCGGAVTPNNVPEQKTKKGGRARHGLEAPCQRVRIEFGAGWGTWERLSQACFAYTLMRLKGRGVYPHCSAGQSLPCCSLGVTMQ